MRPYVPHPRWVGGHRMTLYAWARPRRFARLPPATARYFDVAPEARVLARCHWQARPERCPTLLALHGLEGSSEAHYMRGLADKAFNAGMNAVRLNQRNCGGTEHLSAGLYHSGLTDDVRAVLRELIAVDGLRAVAVVGYSLGGNLALKLAGELGEAAPSALVAVAAVSPTMDLARSVQALERRQNCIYQWHFLRHLKQRMRRKARAWPGRYDLRPLGRIRSIREFDEAYTAPHHGFRDAADYYYRASALRVVHRIRVPALIVSAEDDPFVPADQFRDPVITGNPYVTVVLTPHGGHCGFIAAPGSEDGYWAEQAVVEFIVQRVAEAAPPAPEAP